MIQRVVKMSRFVAFAVLLLCASVQAQDKYEQQPCKSRALIKPELLRLIEPLREDLAAVAVGRGNPDTIKVKLAEVFDLVDQLSNEPTNGCYKRMK